MLFSLFIKLAFVGWSFVLLCLPSAVGAETLNLPFQTAELGNPVREDDLVCERPTHRPVIALSLSSIYDQSDPIRTSVVREQQLAYETLLQPVRAFLLDLAKYASNFTESDGKNVSDAVCALQMLSAWAQADALSDLATRQTWLSVTRIVAGSALAYMQVKHIGPQVGVDTQVIDQWFTRLADGIIPIYTASGERVSNRQNHRYWGGLAVAASGVVTGNADHLEFGIESFQIGVCQVDKHGALPLELARERRARAYHLHAVAPLVMIAALAEANEKAIFDECDSGLDRLVSFTLNSLHDDELITALSGAEQLPIPGQNGKVRGDLLAWTQAYFRYRPDQRARFALNVDGPLSSSTLGGRLSVLFDPDRAGESP